MDSSVKLSLYGGRFGHMWAKAFRRVILKKYQIKVNVVQLLYHVAYCYNGSAQTYSISDKLDKELSAFATSNLSLVVFISGQMVTVGNGTLWAGTGFSVQQIFTGSSAHWIQTLRVINPHIDNDTMKESNQNNRSLQCSFRTLKYRKPCMLLLSQYSMKYFRIFKAKRNIFCA